MGLLYVDKEWFELTLIEVVICYVKWAVLSVWSYGVDAFELVLDIFAAIVNAMLLILPNAVLDEPALDSGLMGNINYFIPFGLLVAEFSTIMMAWIIYRLYQWVLRWGKVEA